MEKLKQALRELGGSNELVEQVCTELDNYTSDIKATYDREYANKVKKAKQICIEEVNKEKAALAKKVKIYLESKAKSVEQALTKQRAIEDTEATSLLKRARGLLEGVNYDDSGVSRELQAAQTKVQRLERQLKAVSEDRNSMISRANRAHTVANDVLTRNKKLEEEVQALKSSISESTTKTSKKETEKDSRVVNEAKDKADKPEGRKRRRKLDESRRVPNKRRSTSRTLSESQNSSKSAGSEINKIADQMPLD